MAAADADQNLSSEEKYRQARQLYAKAKSLKTYFHCSSVLTFILDMAQCFPPQAEQLEEGNAERRELEGEVLIIKISP